MLADVVLETAKDGGAAGELVVLDANPSTAAVETCLPHHRWVRHRDPHDWGSTLANIVPNDAWRSEKDAQVGFAASQREALGEKVDLYPWLASTRGSRVSPAYENEVVCYACSSRSPQTTCPDVASWLNLLIRLGIRVVHLPCSRRSDLR